MLLITESARACSSTCRRATTPSSAPRSATAPASTRQDSGASIKVSPLLGDGLRAACSSARGLTLLEVYERGHELDDVYQLAEQMMTWDERTIVWRFQHLKTVERIIGGNVIGTQGTPVEVLGKRIDVRFFPELWLVRDEITRRSALGTDGHGR